MFHFRPIHHFHRNMSARLLPTYCVPENPCCMCVLCPWSGCAVASQHSAFAESVDVKVGFQHVGMGYALRSSTIPDNDLHFPWHVSDPCPLPPSKRAPDPQASSPPAPRCSSTGSAACRSSTQPLRTNRFSDSSPVLAYASSTAQTAGHQR